MFNFSKLIDAFAICLGYYKADPEDKATIAQLNAQVETLKADLATSQANDPTAEEEARLSALIAEFTAATPPAEPVTGGTEPEPAPVDSPAGES